VIRAWVADAGGARAVEPADAIAAALGGGYAWIDLDCEDEESARQILEPLGVHPLVIEGVAMQLNRPKVDDYGSSLYLVVHSARWDQARPQLREVDIVLGERFLVTYHDGTTRSIAAAHEILPRRPQLLSRGPATLTETTEAAILARNGNPRVLAHVGPRS